jgi:two-component system, NarL family, response regulator DegU
MSQPIKIAVVDDQQLFRKGLIALLKEFDSVDVMLEASNGQEFIEQIATNKPDLVLLDLEMPVMDGIATTIELHKKFPEIKVLIVTMYNEESMILHLIEKGAHGFLLKDNPIEMIMDAIHGIMETGYYFNDMISKVMVKGLMKTNKIKPSFGQAILSDREVEVLRLICQEMTNKEIADKLYLSVRTVDGHREKILQKTGAKNVAGMVMYAMRNNLVE